MTLEDSFPELYPTLNAKKDLNPMGLGFLENTITQKASNHEDDIFTAVFNTDFATLEKVKRKERED